MHLGEEDADLLKRWIVKNIEAISDADSDVLAEYVLALVTSDGDAQPTSKAHYVESLQDFLSSDTQAFVDNLFLAISTKSFDPSRPLPRLAAPAHSSSKRSDFGRAQLPNESRKRSYHDRDANGGLDREAHPHRGYNRPSKQARRGGRGYEDNNTALTMPFARNYGVPQHLPFPPLPTPPPGMSSMHAEHAMATFIAMQKALGMLPFDTPDNAYLPNQRQLNQTALVQRCPDYETKGFCAAGAACPYEHGDDPYVVPSSRPTYDPNGSAASDPYPTKSGRIDTGGGSRGRDSTRGRRNKRGSTDFRGGGKRASFSQSGPSRDPSLTGIVVEQIPEEHCSEESVRSFFSDFGQIDEIIVQPEKSLAVVKFQTNAAARDAYESPKVIFENRFVKVYWYKSDHASKPSVKNSGYVPAQTDEMEYIVEESGEEDIEEITRRQEEAQRKHEQNQQQREQLEKQKQDVEAKLKSIREERRKVADMIVTKTGRPLSPTAEFPEDITSGDSEQTRALKEQLASLEAEAKSLGIDAEAATNGISSTSTQRGRGGYRGRGRGRGSYRGGAVMRLDNRSKTVAITFSDGDYESRNEALLQFLLFNSLDSESMEKHPERDDTALVTFRHRYEGENLMQCIAYAGIQHLGAVEMSWFKAEPGSVATNGVDGHTQKADSGPDDVQMAVTADVDLAEAQGHAPEVVEDEDEDEDLDRWA